MINLSLLRLVCVSGGSVMRKVVSLIAFCSMIFADNVSYAEANNESLSDKDINEIVTELSSEDLQKLVQTAEKKGKLSTKKSKKSANKKSGKKKKKKKNVQNSQNSTFIENGELDGNIGNANQNQSTTKKKKKKNKKKKQKNIQNSESNIIANSNAYVGDINNTYQNQQVTKKSKKKKNKKRKKKSNLQKVELTTNVNQNRSISKNINNQSAIFANKEDANRSYQIKKTKKENNTDESWKYEVISASDLTNRDKFTAINEPVIDKAKIQKSSLVIEKDVKLASNSEKTKVRNKVTSPKVWSSNKNIKLATNEKVNELEKKITPLKPLDKEKILAHLDSNKDGNFVANLSSSETAIKDKLQQIKNNRETYNLIKTPNKDLKDNIQVNKFRAELDHYRKIFTLNMKKA